MRLGRCSKPCSSDGPLRGPAARRGEGARVRHPGRDGRFRPRPLGGFHPGVPRVDLPLRACVAPARPDRPQVELAQLAGSSSARSRSWSGVRVRSSTVRPLGDQVDGDLLGGQVLGVVDQFVGPAAFADAVGQIVHGQRGRGDRQHQGCQRYRVDGLAVLVGGPGCRRRRGGASGRSPGPSRGPGPAGCAGPPRRSRRWRFRAG